MKHAAHVEPDVFRERRFNLLARRLVNWGLWCNYEAEIGPEYPRCKSFESTHVAEIGDTTTDDRHGENPVPDIEDAIKMHKLIRILSPVEQYVLALTYPGAPAVLKWKRLGDFQIKRALDSAFEKLRGLTNGAKR